MVDTEYTAIYTFPQLLRFQAAKSLSMLQSSSLMNRPTAGRALAAHPQVGGAGSRLNDGLLRTILSGRGGMLPEAFANLEQAVSTEQITRHFKRGILGCRIQVAPEEGHGHWDLIRVRNELYIVAQDFSLKGTRRELMGGDDLLQFNFRLSGDLSIQVSHTESVHLSCPSLFVWNRLPGSGIYERTAAGAHHRAVSISVRPHFVIDELLTSGVDIPRPLCIFMSGQRGPTTYLQLPLSAQMFELASKLIQHSHTGALALVYIEAVAMELLCESVKYLGKERTALDVRYTPRALQCLQSARAILMRQFAPPPTIRQVARSVGVNETTLKHDFKAAFGETIFDFGLRCRMQRALVLLQEERWPVCRVGEAIGYSHQTSFATAFRRHFGMCPKDVRRSCGP